MLVGMLAFLINIAVENGPQDPLNVYHFNLSSHDILLFVRDGLLSKLLVYYCCCWCVFVGVRGWVGVREIIQCMPFVYHIITGQELV